MAPCGDDRRSWRCNRGCDGAVAESRAPHARQLTIDHIEAEAPGNCRDVNYDPLVLPDGIEPSDDPCSAPAPPPILPRSRAAPARQRRRARYKPPTPAKARHHDAKISGLLAHAPLADGRDDPRHAVHRHRHGGIDWRNTIGSSPFTGRSALRS